MYIIVSVIQKDTCNLQIHFIDSTLVLEVLRAKNTKRALCYADVSLRTMRVQLEQGNEEIYVIQMSLGIQQG